MARQRQMLYKCAVADDFRWRPVLARLSREFEARNMRAFMTSLERFRAGYEAQLKRLASMRFPPWTSETVLELAARFQVPPFQEFYLIAPKDGRCPHCRVDLSKEGPVTEAVMADRTLLACRACGKRWLVQAPWTRT